MLRRGPERALFSWAPFTLAGEGMAVETTGSVRMRGQDGPGAPVRIAVAGGRLRIVAGAEEVGDWNLDEIGIHAVSEGFSIRAEGEEFVLRAEDEVALAEEFGFAAATPRLARKVAAAHNPEPRPEPEPTDSVTYGRGPGVVAITFALGGLLVLLGGVFLRPDTTAVATLSGGGEPSFLGLAFWVAFIAGGVLMVAVAIVMSLGSRWSRLVALLVVVAVVVLFVSAVSGVEGDSAQFTAYGFIAGGIVVGVAVLFSGGLGAE